MKKRFRILTALFCALLFGCQINAPSSPNPTTPAVAISDEPEPPTVTPTAEPSGDGPVDQVTTAPDEDAPSTPTPIIPTPTPTTTPADRQPREPNGHLNIGLVGALVSLNPLTSLEPVLEQISPLLYPSLHQIDPDSAMTAAGLAALPDISADGLTLTYRLQAGSVEIDDITASIEQAIWPELADIRQATPLGANSFSVQLAEPNCALVDRLSHLPVLSAASTEAEMPQASGPFQVERWDAEAAQLHLVANPDGGHSPLLKSMMVHIFPDEAAAWKAFQAGEIDLLPVRTFPDEIPTGYRTMAYPAPLLTFVGFNNQDAVLSQAAVRQALRLALNRTGVLETAFLDQGELASTIYPAAHWAASSLVPAPYAPDQAGQLLDEAGLIDRNDDGWRDLANGETWHLSIRVLNSDQALMTVAFLAAETYRQLGIYAQAEPVPDYALYDNLLDLDYQIAVYGLPVQPELDRLSYWHSEQIDAEFGINLIGYDNPQVDAWLEEANQTPNCDTAARGQLYQQIQTAIEADTPLDFLISPHYFLVAREDIQGLAPGPFAPFTWNAANWRLE